MSIRVQDLPFLICLKSVGSLNIQMTCDAVTGGCKDYLSMEDAPYDFKCNVRGRGGETQSEKGIV